MMTKRMPEHALASARLKWLLKQKGLTQWQAADAICELRQSLTQTINFERENRRVREKVSKLLKLSVRELFPPSIECMPARFRDRLREEKE